MAAALHAFFIGPRLGGLGDPVFTFLEIYRVMSRLGTRIEMIQNELSSPPAGGGGG